MVHAIARLIVTTVFMVATVANALGLEWEVVGFTGSAYVRTNARMADHTQGWQDPKREPEVGYYWWDEVGSEMNGLVSAVQSEGGNVTSIAMWTGFSRISGDDFRADAGTSFIGGCEFASGYLLEGVSIATVCSFQEGTLDLIDYGDATQYTVTATLRIDLEHIEAIVDERIDAPKEVYLDCGSVDDPQGLSWIYATYSSALDRWTIYATTSEMIEVAGAYHNKARLQIYTRQGYAAIDGFGVVHQHVSFVDDAFAWKIEINPYEQANTVNLSNYGMGVESMQHIHIRAIVDMQDVEVME